MGGGVGSRFRGDRGFDRFELARLDLVRLGQDQPVADRGIVQHLHHLAVDVLEAVARVDQDQDALQRRASAQIVVDQLPPLAGHVPGRPGEAVARHVDQPEAERIADIEEVQFLGPPRRGRGPGEAGPVGEPVEQRGFADVRAAGKGDFGRVGGRQELELRRRLQKGDRPGECLAGDEVDRFLFAVHFFAGPDRPLALESGE
jgi:hypothetical protein